jgi:HK97 gp10 family phage protein
MAKFWFDAKRAELAVMAAAHDAQREIAKDILHDAQMHAPVDTGALKASGHIEDNGKTVSVVFDVSYARYVEFGTSKMRAQPFLTPAAFKRR